MKDEQENSVIPFSIERKERQEQWFTAFSQLQNELMDDINRSVNLREKVRAKHLFRSAVGITEEQLLLPKWEIHFLYWLMCEYVNIKGERMLERYVTQYTDTLSQQKLTVAGHWLAAYPSIYQIIECAPDFYEVKELWGEHKHQVGIPKENCSESLERDDYIFMRITKVGYEQYATGPCEKIKAEQVPAIKQSMIERFVAFKQRVNQATWRLFMLQHGIEVLHK